ncbi:Beta-glucanase precursor [Stieleria maiorica]|uniref:Beta-glucanase n=1 Tax=Stieleria maiorica TaxID=2795974 RepID=A0A5B9M9A8_9BACT|nr:glycoside hydrolase family 16 protein [Stieleria maiorica]QEF96620.1 Beta-glucanase precursor [Stieleria maiorica]
MNHHYDLSVCLLTCVRCCFVVSAVLALSVPSPGEGLEAGKVLWSDEFDGPALDRTIWTHDVGGHGFGNGQLEYNTDRPENAYVRDGNLVIQARQEAYQGNAFTSARIHTRGGFAFQYGDLEARIKLPDTADGIWPAFWMLGNSFPETVWPKCGEADILEIGGKDGIESGLQHRKINCALHFAGVGEQKTSLVEWYDAPEDLHLDYHLYRISWTPTHMKFFLDGKEFGSWDITAPEMQEYHQPYFPILNVAVGSWTHSYTGLDKPEKITATFPARMYVDWIRLYGHPNTKVYLGGELQ